MTEDFFTLPKYPLNEDMWDTLKKETRPIVIYGMGNGADKLIDRFNALGISYADIFASDGFVRGHSFHGVVVKSFSEIKEKYDSFVIVLSFASNKPDVIDMLADINKNYDMLVPDMPVAGVEEYFDKDFYNANYSDIQKAYNALCDEKSKNFFASIINFKLFGRMDALESAYTNTEEMYSLFDTNSFELTVDAGAYNGDTVREIKGFFKNLKKVYAIEPDRRNFKKLSIYSEAENEISVIPCNAAAWRENVVGEFFDSGNRNSTVVATSSHEHKVLPVDLITVDSLSAEKIDYIKYDVEGAEYEALLGSHGTIKRDRPAMLVSLYHRSKDIFFLVNFLHERYTGYRFFLRRLRCLPAWEINLLLVPT